MRLQSFREFYPYYLQEHTYKTCRALHYIGSSCILLVVAYVLFGGSAWWLLSLPIIGYGFAWVGHFLFEHNKPATFEYPLYSLMGDWVMYKDAIVYACTGKRSAAAKQAWPQR